ncbi:MAG TPA: hypothetical protein PKD51_12770 [Saprospiraceae bacterium]|nr:hypothetical protein [Saprospiraceae bacterium]HMU02456.1 hypothetical protein [Saprospiraceae bacterium]
MVFKSETVDLSIPSVEYWQNIAPSSEVNVNDRKYNITKDQDKVSIKRIKPNFQDNMQYKQTCRAYINFDDFKTSQKARCEVSINSTNEYVFIFISVLCIILCIDMIISHFELGLIVSAVIIFQVVMNYYKFKDAQVLFISDLQTDINEFK